MKNVQIQRRNHRSSKTTWGKWELSLIFIAGFSCSGNGICIQSTASWSLPCPAATVRSNLNVLFVSSWVSPSVQILDNLFFLNDSPALSCFFTLTTNQLYQLSGQMYNVCNRSMNTDDHRVGFYYSVCIHRMNWFCSDLSWAVHCCHNSFCP